MLLKVLDFHFFHLLPLPLVYRHLTYPFERQSCPVFQNHWLGTPEPPFLWTFLYLFWKVLNSKCCCCRHKCCWWGSFFGRYETHSRKGRNTCRNFLTWTSFEGWKPNSWKGCWIRRWHEVRELKVPNHNILHRFSNLPKLVPIRNRGSTPNRRNLHESIFRSGTVPNPNRNQKPTSTHNFLGWLAMGR